jgi:hypothetical protein
MPAFSASRTLIRVGGRKTLSLSDYLRVTGAGRLTLVASELAIDDGGSQSIGSGSHYLRPAKQQWRTAQVQLN